MKQPAALLGVALLLPAGPAVAVEHDTSLMLRLLASAWQYQDPLPGSDDGSGAGLIGRVISDIRPGNGLQLKINLFQTWLDEDLAGSGSDALLLGAERSGALETNLSDRDYAHLGVDTLSLAWHSQRLDLTLGRQPINLATTFYFSANDVFAPYATQDFYRIYKPGVDALRADLALTDLSALRLYAVSGFRPDPAADTGWSDDPDGQRHSLLAQYNGVIRDTDLSLVAGRLRGDRFAATGLQGELGEWLGLRIEAQWRQQPEPADAWLLSHTLGFEHRFDNSLDLRLELYRNGRGAGDTSDYLQTLLAATDYPGEPVNLARHYAAFGASYQLTPLWTAQGLVIHNRVDDSGLIAASAQYSVSDEADLTLGVTHPFGDKSRLGIPRSEYGSAPRMVTAEIKSYF